MNTFCDAPTNETAPTLAIAAPTQPVGPTLPNPTRDRLRTRRDGVDAGAGFLPRMAMVAYRDPAQDKPLTAEPAEGGFDYRRSPADWPHDLEMILSAMDAAGGCADRRRLGRVAYRSTAHLHLFADGNDAEGHTVYTRDVDARGLGFISPERLPLGYGG